MPGGAPRGYLETMIQRDSLMTLEAYARERTQFRARVLELLGSVSKQRAGEVAVESK